MRPFVGGWVSERVRVWVSECVRPSCFALWARYRLQFLPDHIQTSHAHVDDERRNPIDFESRGQRSRSTLALCCIKPCGQDTDNSFCTITFKLLMQVVDDERRNPIDFESRGQRSRSTLALCCIKPCGQDTDYSVCTITFKLHMQVVEDERRNPIDFGSQGQRSRSTLAICV